VDSKPAAESLPREGGGLREHGDNETADERR